VITVPGNQFVNIAIQPLGLDTLVVSAATRSDSTKTEEKHSYEAETNIQNIRDQTICIIEKANRVPVGLISFVNHGYHKIEISADEIFYSNIAFRTGVRRFYNILSAGMKPEKAFGNNETVLTFGYGIGTAPRLTRWLDLNIDLTSNQVNKGRFTSELSLLNKVVVGLDVRFARKMSLTLGAALNGYLTRNTFTDYPVFFTDYSPHIINDHNFNNKVNLKMWWGLKAGLRFL